MNAASAPTLPLATTSPFTPRGIAPDASEWKCAWVRASCETARHPLCPPSVPWRESVPSEAPLAVQVLPPGAAPGVQEVGLAGTEAPEPRMHAGKSIVHEIQPYTAFAVARPAAVSIELVPGEVEDVVQENVSRSPLRKPDHPAVHVHVEERPDGLAVWLGIAGDTGQKPRVAALLYELRRHWPAIPLASLVCNGQSLYDPSSSPKETP